MTDILQQFVIDAEHPWPGLMPFTEEAQPFFHGRDQEAAELLRLIRRETLTVLFGQSGLGKSSLLNAGLFPRLRNEDYFPVYIRLDVADHAPPFIAQVKQAILLNCQQHHVDYPAAPDDETLWGWFHHRDADFWSTRNRLLTPVLVFDQFEEIFTLGQHGDELEARCRDFLGELACLIENRMPESLAARIEADPAAGANLDYGKHALKVLFSFREDYLPEFEGLRTLIRPIMQNRMRLSRMSGEQAVKAIRQAGGHLVTETVAGQIVRFVAAPRSGRESGELARLEVEPALMSVVCRELNNRRLKAGQKEISAALLSGGAQQQIIHDFYESSLADIDNRVRIFIEDSLLTDAGYRDSCALEDALLLPGVTRERIDILIGRRLLRLEERSGVLRVELTHDVLTRVAKESRDNRKQAERLQQLKAQEAERRRKSRRMTIFIGASLSVAISLAVVFAVLLGRANHQKELLLKTQSMVLLSRANSALEQGAPGDPYAMLAESIRLDPQNHSAAARAISLFDQRRQPIHVRSDKLAGTAEFGWLNEGKYFVAAEQTAIGDVNQSRFSRLSVQAANNEYQDAGLLTLGQEQQASIAGMKEFSPDSKIYKTSGQGYPALTASGLLPYVSSNYVLHLFDIKTLKPVIKPLQLAGMPMGIGISQNGRWMASVSTDHKLTVARMDGSATRNMDFSLELDASINPVGFVTDSGTVFIQGASAGLLIRSGGAPLGIPGVAGRVAVNAAYSVMAVPGKHEVQLFDVNTGRTIGSPLKHPSTLRDVAFSPDGKYLATASLDKQARVWSVATQALAYPPFRHYGPVLAVRFGDDARTLFTASADGAVRVWDVARGELLAEPMLHGEAVVDLLPQPGGDYVLTMTAGHEFNVWRWRHPAQPRPLIAALKGAVTQVAASQDGQRIAFGTAEGEILAAQAGSTPQVLWQAGSGGGSPVGAIELSPDGKTLAVSRPEGVLFYEAQTGRKLPLVLQHIQEPYLMRFSHNGKQLATLEEGGAARVWNMSTGQQVGPRYTHRQPIQSISFSPDDTLLLIGGQKGLLKLWDAANGLPRGDLNAAGGDADRLLLADFADNHSVITVIGDHVRITSLERDAGGELRLPQKLGTKKLALGNLRPWTAALSPGRDRVAIGALDGRLRLVDVKTLSFTGETMRHDDAVLGISWMPDANSFASWSRDRTVRLWDAESGYSIADNLTFDAEPRMVRASNGNLAILADKGVIQPVGTVPPGNAPSWLPEFLEAAGGVRLDNGTVVRLDNQEDIFRKVMREDGKEGAWGAWFAKSMERMHGVAAQKQTEPK